MPAPIPRECEITAFFASVDSYVSLAEKLPLPLLNELMTSYYTACTDAIKEGRGIFDKFVGDAAVAWFDESQKEPRHALRACVTALQLQGQIARLRNDLNRDRVKWPEIARKLRVRVGLHTGGAIVGQLDVSGHLGSTIMGDNVNLAARLEKGAKTYGAQIICTGQTKAVCDSAGLNQIVFRSLGKIVVKGRMERVHLYEPMAFSSEATDELRECISSFEKGLERYRELDWSGAAEQFRKSAALEPMDTGSERNPSVVFLDWVERARQNPPSPAFLP